MKTTKFVNLLLLAVLCLGFASCSDDDDDENTYNDSIVGTWASTLNNTKIEINTNNPAFTKAFVEFVKETTPAYKQRTFTAEGKCRGYIYYTEWSGVDYTYVDDVLSITYGNEKKISSLLKIRDDIAIHELDMKDDFNRYVITVVIKENESLKDIDPNSIIVSKYLVTETWYRK